MQPIVFGSFRHSSNRWGKSEATDSLYEPPQEALLPGMALMGSAVMVPSVILASNRVVESVDSTAFCAQTCHDVHDPEAVTFGASPHLEVTCSSCQVGSGTEVLVRSTRHTAVYVRRGWVFGTSAFGTNKPLNTVSWSPSVDGYQETAKRMLGQMAQPCPLPTAEHLGFIF